MLVLLHEDHKVPCFDFTDMKQHSTEIIKNERRPFGFVFDYNKTNMIKQIAHLV